MQPCSCVGHCCWTTTAAYMLPLKDVTMCFTMASPQLSCWQRIRAHSQKHLHDMAPVNAPDCPHHKDWPGIACSLSVLTGSQEGTSSSTPAARARDQQSPLSELPVQLEGMSLSAGRKAQGTPDMQNAEAAADTGLPTPAAAAAAVALAAPSSSMQTPAAPVRGCRCIHERPLQALAWHAMKLCPGV